MPSHHQPVDPTSIITSCRDRRCSNLADGEFPGSASVIDGATCNGRDRDTSGCGQTPATAPTGFGTKDIAADPTTHDVYTTNDEDTSVTTINGDTCRGTQTTGCSHTITRPIVGDYPRAIGLAPSVRTAYIADSKGYPSSGSADEPRCSPRRCYQVGTRSLRCSGCAAGRGAGLLESARRHPVSSDTNARPVQSSELTACISIR